VTRFFFHSNVVQWSFVCCVVSVVRKLCWVPVICCFFQVVPIHGRFGMPLAPGGMQMAGMGGFGMPPGGGGMQMPGGMPGMRGGRELDGNQKCQQFGGKMIKKLVAVLEKTLQKYQHKGKGTFGAVFGCVKEGKKICHQMHKSNFPRSRIDPERIPEHQVWLPRLCFFEKAQIFREKNGETWNPRSLQLRSRGWMHEHENGRRNPDQVFATKTTTPRSFATTCTGVGFNPSRNSQCKKSALRYGSYC
jgi:hypothetical protein